MSHRVTMKYGSRGRLIEKGSLENKATLNTAAWLCEALANHMTKLELKRA